MTGGYSGQVRFWIFLIVFGLGFGAGITASSANEGTHVYMFRGILNVFSTGLDEIARQLEERGIDVTVLSHVSTGAARAEILDGGSQRRPGTRPLVLVGHSLGANAVLSLSESLAEDDIPVKLVITLDPTTGGPLSPNVRRYINYHFSDSKLIGFAGTPIEVQRRVRDINLRDYAAVAGQSIGHFSMDSNETLQKEIIASILQALR